MWVFTKKSMTVRKPSTSNGSQLNGDNAPGSPLKDLAQPIISQNVSGVDLASRAKLRHRSPGPPPSIPLEDMTPLTPRQNDAQPVEEEAVEADEDEPGLSLRLTGAGPVVSKPESALISHAVSSKRLV